MAEYFALLAEYLLPVAEYFVLLAEYLLPVGEPLLPHSILGYSSKARCMPDPMPRYGISFVANVNKIGFRATETPDFIFAMS